MSWELSLMSNWTSAGGRPLANLGPADKGSEIRWEVGGRGTATLVLKREIAYALVDGRSIIRMDGLRRGYAEVRVVKRSLPDDTTFTVVGNPRIYDLSDADLLYEELGGRKIFRFNGALLPSEYFSRFLFARQAERGLVGIAPGVLAYTEKVPLQWERITAGELVSKLQEALAAEVAWRIAEDGTELLDLVPFVADDAETVPLYYGDRLRTHAIEEDYKALATVVRVAGEPPTVDSERATIGENWWDVRASRDVGAGVVALELRAPGTMESPILEDGQYAADADIDLPARYVQREDGVTRLRIRDSIAASSEVLVSGSVPAVGELVCLVADADGAPLETLELPSAIRRYGVVVGDVPITGGRGEKQYARNGGHEDGITGWSSANGGAAAEYKRTEFGTTITGEANGARAGGVGTGTPFAVKALGANRWIRRGYQLQVGGVTLAIDADAIPDASGALALDLATPGLPANYADNTPFTLIRREVRTWTLDGEQSVLSLLRWRDSNTDQLLTGYAGTWVAGGISGAFGSLAYITGGAGAVMMGRAVGFDQSVNFSASGIAPYTARWSNVPITPGSDTATFVLQGVDGGGPLIVGQTRIRWTRQDGFLQVARVTAVVGSTVTLVSESHPTLGLPASWQFDSGTGAYAFAACDDVIADGTTAVVTIERETRTLRLDGAHTAGDTTALFKAQANLATRDWLSTDTVELRRVLTGTLDLTDVGAATPVFDEDTEALLYYELVCTFDPSSSTLDDLDPGDWAGAALSFQSGGSATWRLASIIGNMAYFYVLVPTAITTPLPIGVVSATWTQYDTYALTGTAAWGADGLATLTLARAVPAGRTYARGEPVWATWHSRGSVGTNTLLRVHVQLDPTDTTLVLAGQDPFLLGSTPTASLPLGVYVVRGGSSPVQSSIPIPGNTLYAAASVQANGAGEASIVLTAANANAIADGDPITIIVPPLLPVTQRRTGSALRLFCPVGDSGDPLPESGGQGHALAYFRVPTNSTRTITARAYFTLSAGDWYAGDGPVLALIDAVGTILGFQRLGDEGLTVDTTPGEVMLTAQATISQSGFYGFRVFGGSTADYTKWCVHLETMHYLGEATDAPYTSRSWSTRMTLAGLKRLDTLSRPRITDRLTIGEWNAAQLAAAGVRAIGVPPVVMGGRVHLEAWDRIERVTTIVERPEQPVAEIEIGQLARDGSRILTNSALIASQEVR